VEVQPVLGANLNRYEFRDCCGLRADQCPGRTRSRQIDKPSASRVTRDSKGMRHAARIRNVPMAIRPTKWTVLASAPNTSISAEIRSVLATLGAMPYMNGTFH
jgi:hypothetical protein